MSKLSLYVLIVGVCCFTQHLSSMVTNCPFPLTSKEKMIIEENLQNFKAKLNKQTDIQGGDATKRYDLRCTDLSNLNFAANFKYLDLRGACLDGSDFSTAKFEFVDLRKASLKKIRANRAQFWDCILDEADFSDSDMPSVSFLGSKLPLSAIKTNFTKANISAGSQLSNIDVSGAIFDQADLNNVGFAYVKVSPQTSFKKTNLTMAKLDQTTGQPSSLLAWLLGQGADLANTFIDGKYTDIPTH